MPKSRFSKILTKIAIVRKFWPTSGFFESLTSSNLDFSKNLPKSRWFENFDQMWIFRKFWPKSRFSNSLIKIEIFRKSSPKLRFSKILTKITIFYNFCPKYLIIFKKIWLLLRFFKNFDQNRDVSNKIEVFRKIIPELEIVSNLKKTTAIFRKFCPKIDIFENVHQNQVFEQFWPKSLFSKFWPKIEIFVWNQDLKFFFNQNRGISRYFGNLLQDQYI